MTVLAPCPFCGLSVAATYNLKECEVANTYAVICDNCGAQGPYHPTEAEAITGWNMRVESRLSRAVDAIIANSKPISPNASTYRLLGRDYRELAAAVKEAKGDG